MEVFKMDNLTAMFWVELRKAIRSRMPLWTALGALLMPFGIAFLIFVSKNPEISKKLGLISAKADLVAYAATNWQTYLGFFGQLIAAGGYIFYVFIISWVFGREFVDGTVKDMLAVPVRRSSILLAKFGIVTAWSVLLTVFIFIAGLFMGALLRLPGGSLQLLLQAGKVVGICGLMVICVVLPFALFAGLGRGYLLPIGLAILTLMATNLVIIIGNGDYFPWAIPGLYAQAKSPLPAASYWIVILTGLAGIFATYLWWKNADQSR
jgi:ABC-2 type transport system permease protein